MFSIRMKQSERFSPILPMTNHSRRENEVHNLSKSIAIKSFSRQWHKEYFVGNKPPDGNTDGDEQKNSSDKMN